MSNVVWRACSGGVAAAAISLGLMTPVSGRSLADIEESGTFEVCLQEDNAPFSDQHTNKGVLVDIGDLVANKLGVKMVETWLFSAEYVRKTSCDLVPAVADIPNDEPLRLSSPYVEIRSLAVSRVSAAKLSGAEDFKGRSIGVLANSYARHVFSQKGYKLSVHYLENEEILKAVEDGEIDVGIVPQTSFDWYARQRPDRLRADASPVGTDFDYSAALGLRRADKPLLAKVNDILREAVADGTVRGIFERYGLRYEAPKAN